MNVPDYVRWPLAVLLVAHGAIHALGFIWAFDLAEVEGLGGPSMIIAGLESGHPAILAFGILWLVAMVGFMIAGVGVALRTWWALPLAGAAAGISLVPTVVWWNDAWIGALFSGSILVAIVAIRPRFATPQSPGPARPSHAGPQS